LNENVAEAGGNLTELKRGISVAFEDIKNLKGKRESVNSSISAIIEDLESKGINRHAFRMAMQYMAMDENQRKGFDFAYEVVREALGEPLQADFDFAPKVDPDVPADPETGEAAANPEDTGIAFPDFQDDKTGETGLEDELEEETSTDFEDDTGQVPTDED
jgi:hypothetical protein